MIHATSTCTCLPLNYVLGQSPNENGDTTFAILLVRCKSVNAVLPRNVNVAAEAEHAIVWLGEINPALLAIGLLGGMDEGLQHD